MCTRSQLGRDHLIMNYHCYSSHYGNYHYYTFNIHVYLKYKWLYLYYIIHQRQFNVFIIIYDIYMTNIIEKENCGPIPKLIQGTQAIPGMRVGRHGGYCHEIWHRAWQIETGSWWCEMHWLLWQKRGSPGPL